MLMNMTEIPPQPALYHITLTLTVEEKRMFQRGCDAIAAAIERADSCGIDTKRIVFMEKNGSQETVREYEESIVTLMRFITSKL